MKKRLISLFTAAALLCMLMTNVLVGSVGASAGDESDTTLAPGKVDWLTVSDELAYTDDSGNKIAAAGGCGGYRYQLSYATVGCLSEVDKHLFSDNLVYAIDSGFNQYAGISAGTFMGKKITGAIASDRMWAGNYVQYQVQGGSYIATALILHENIASDFFDSNGNSQGKKYKEYGFQASANGSTWQNVTATIQFEGYGTGFWIYKAVVQIPKDCQYYRVVLPGFDKLDASTGWHQSADNYFWRVFIGPSVASNNDLSKCKTLEDAFKEKTVLAPGVYDWLEAKEDLVCRFDDGNKVNSEQSPGGYRYRPAIATSGFENVTGYPDYDVPHVVDSGHVKYSSFADATFMGKGNIGLVQNPKVVNGSTMPGYIQYEVEGGSYVASMLFENQHLFYQNYGPDTALSATGEKAFKLKVSADGETWTDVTTSATYTYLGLFGNEYKAAKAVVHIPEDCQYYRIVFPVVNDLWMIYLGPSVASAYDLTKYDVLTAVPDSPDYIDIYKELKKAISDSESVNLNAYEDDEAMTAFVNKLAEAKAYLKETHTHEEYIAMANALLEAKEALNSRLAPHKATIKQDDPKHILQPGVADWLTGSALLNADGTYYMGTNNIQSWYITYTDYAKPGVLAKQDGVNQSPDAGIQISDYDFIQFDTLSKLNYMGRPVNNVVYATRSWAACNMTYRVYSGSYVSTALICLSDNEALRNGFQIQTSTDGETWVNVDQPSITPVAQTAETGYDVYKAVIKMPEGHTYYRIFLPGAQMIDPNTTWYAGNPDFLSSFLGATISSMYDLTQYDDYADIPDATEYYGEAPLTSTDEEQLIISEGYFKLQTEDMTVAEALALLDPSTGSARFYDVNGNLITNDDTKLTAGMQAEILDPKGISLTAALGYDKLKVVLGNDLLSISKLDDIYLDYGVDKTIEGLKLPKTVSIEAGTGNYDAEIKWDVDSIDFDPAITQTQQFTVKGKLILPEGVSNNGGIDLTVEVNVLVSGSTDIGIRVIDTKKIKLDEENKVLYVQNGLTLDELRKALMPVGDVNIVFYDADGELLEDESVVVEAGMMLDVETEVVLFASYEIVPISDMGDVEIPDTGVATSVGLISLLMLCTAGLLTLSKKKYAGCKSK